MSDWSRWNKANPSIKRILAEARELKQNPPEDFSAEPLEDDVFEWHFTIRGPLDTEFEGGRYHGRIVLPHDYPLKPPTIYFLNESGRFEVGKKICLSVSSHHPETWQPSWSIRTVLVALMGFMPTEGKGAIGALDYPKDERQRLAQSSRKFVCKSCEAEMETVLCPDEDRKVKKASSESSSRQGSPRGSDRAQNAFQGNPFVGAEDIVLSNDQSTPASAPQSRSVNGTPVPESVDLPPTAPSDTDDVQPSTPQLVPRPGDQQPAGYGPFPSQWGGYVPFANTPVRPDAQGGQAPPYIQNPMHMFPNYGAPPFSPMFYNPMLAANMPMFNAAPNPMGGPAAAGTPVQPPHAAPVAPAQAAAQPQEQRAGLLQQRTRLDIMIAAVFIALMSMLLSRLVEVGTNTGRT